MLRACGFSDKGRTRPTNEDCYWFDEHLGLCVIADGMGGHNAGEVAARMAVDAVADYVRGAAAVDDAWPFGFDPALSPAGNRLRTAVHLANVQVLEAAVSTREYSGMGTTIVAALVEDGRLAVAHVGDSRLYVFGVKRVSDTCLTPGVTSGLAPCRLRQVTRDDSWMASVLATDPRVDPVLLLHHPMRNALTNVVGGRACTHVHVVEEQLGGGELLVLTTDGVHGVVDDRQLEQVLLEDGAIGAGAERLVAAALARGSRDNCTAVLARYSSD